ncbi:hypothetical protein BH20PSE1_BH20PSE1_11090 [soil metagenome]
MRNLRVKTIVVSATMGLALVVAGMPGTAEADVCGTVGSRAGCVTSRDVRNNNLRGADIRNNSLTGADVADNSLTGADVADNSLTAADLNDEAGANFASGDQTVALTITDQTVRSVTITAPTPGLVIVSASGFFQFGSGTVVDNGQCSITTGTALDDTHLISAAEANAGLNHTLTMPFGATRGFEVAAGSTAFNLVCNQLSGAVTVNDTSLTAIFVPTRY